MMCFKKSVFLSFCFISLISTASAEHIYDPSRDALTDYQHALVTATAEHKNIFVIAGGDWCVYCHKLEENLKAVSLDVEIENNFVFMKANFGDGNDNEGFFTLFPKFNGYPHIMVISSNGELLASTNVESEKQFRGLLSKYSEAK